MSDKNQRTIKWVALALIAVSVLVSLGLDFFRLRAEAINRSVELLVDYDELDALATANEIPISQLAARFGEAGATGVLMRERTLKELQERGDIVIMKGADLFLLQQTNPWFFPGLEPVKQDTYIITPEKTVHETIIKKLAIVKEDISGFQNRGIFLIRAPLTEKELEKLGVGFLHTDLDAVQQSGLRIVPRIREGVGSSEQGIKYLGETLEAIPGLSLLTFNDPVIPGSDNLPLLAAELQKLGVPVGMFEFFPQAGLNTLARLLDKNAVRIHAISENDMTRYNESMAVERYSLAVSERNIRALYVRLFGLDHPANSLERALKFVAEIKVNLEREGFAMGEAAMLPGIPYSRAFMFVIGWGVLAAGALLLASFLPLSLVLLLALLGLFGWAGLLFLDPLMARKAFALLGVIIFPVLGITTLLRREKRSLKEAVGALLLMSGISLAGAVIMTGLLADKSFMLTLDIFKGVKLAHLAPLLLVPAFYALKEDKPVTRFKEILNYPVLNKHAAVGFVVAAALAVYIIRTGNDAPQLVTSWETTLRSLLDQILGVRPRTKEFLVGHPAMLILLYYGYDLRKIGLLLFGIIGQVSLVNTYAHIHTPLLISLTRSAHGLWIGIVVGAVIILIVNYLVKRLEGRLARE